MTYTSAIPDRIADRAATTTGLQNVVETLAPVTADINRRAYERKFSESAVYMWIGRAADGTGGIALRGAAVDLSQGGAKIAVAREFVAGQRLDLEFMSVADARGVFATPAVVRWVSEQPDALWHVGFQFSKLMNLSEMLALLR